jgi:hypothetical protein
MKIGTGEQGNEFSGFVKCWKSPDQLGDTQLFRTDSVPQNWFKFIQIS